MTTSSGDDSTPKKPAQDQPQSAPKAPEQAPGQALPKPQGDPAPGGPIAGSKASPPGSRRAPGPAQGPMNGIGPIGGRNRNHVPRRPEPTGAASTPAPGSPSTGSPTAGTGAPAGPLADRLTSGAERAADTAKHAAGDVAKAAATAAGAPPIGEAIQAADVGKAATDGAKSETAPAPRPGPAAATTAAPAPTAQGSLRSGLKRPGATPSLAGGGLAAAGRTEPDADGNLSAKDDAKNIATDIAKGAATGGIAGAAKGTITGLAKSKRGRKVMLWSAAAFVLPPLLVLVLVMGVLSTLSSNVSAESTAQNARSLSGMTEDGVPISFINVAAGASAEESIRFEITTAAAFHSGADLEAEPKEYTEDEQKDAIENDDPIGPYGFFYNDANKIWHGEMKRKDLDFHDLVDPDTATRIYADIVDHFANKENLDERDLDMARGVEEILDEEDGSINAYQVGESSEDTEDAEEVRNNWTTVLASMPTDGADENAETVYDTAFTWFLGRASGCAPGGAIGVSGTWVNPLPGSPAPSSEQDFGPRETGQGFHDGVDLNGSATGSPVVAASSGIASVEASTGYGANWVKIDHGGGIETWYGHLVSADITDGQQVSAGQQIGVEGNEGTYSEGIHLHFSVLENGDFVDPVPFMASRGVNLYGPAGAGGVVPVTTPTTPTTPVVTPTSTSGTTDPNTIRIVQANIPSRSADRMGAISKAYSTGPDFVSFNEMFWASVSQFTAAGYEGWRAPRGGEHLESMSTGIAWRTDRWTKVDSGRITLVRNGPLSNDNRYAQWVTVTSPTLGTVSFISAHQMVNPARIGPNPKRQDLYRAGMEKIQDLVATLKAKGPVFLAGDLNSQYTANDPWGPRKMLGAAGLVSSFDTLGVTKTHVDGGVIDYIFGPKGDAIATRQWTHSIASDHLAIGADWSLDPAAVTTGTGVPLPSSWTGTSSDGESVTLDSTQLGYAQTIAAKGASMGVSDPGIIIALMTVFVETKFKNYASDVYPETMTDPRVYPADAIGSDHDSVGLFQQRPESGWGEPLELLDPAYTASAFFGGPSGPNGGSPAGLLGQPAGWESRDKGSVAQSVQGSAHPERYAKWEAAATELFALVKNSAAVTTTGSCGATDLAVGTGFTIGSFNVLGHSHTKPGGNKAHMGFDQYDARLDSAVAYLQQYDVSVVGLQEFEPIQNRYLVEKHGATYDVWPKNTNMTDAIAWRKADWTFVSGQTFNIPYFGGNQKPMPAVQLTNNGTGQAAWFITIHNPADVRGNAAAFRAEALKRELALAKQLNADGTPVYLTGDFNADDEPHCYLTPDMTSAFGAGTENPCTAPKAVHIDQIFSLGDPAVSGGAQHKEANNRQTSDHPLVTASVITSFGAFGTVPSEYNLGASTPATVNAANILGPMFGISVIGGQSNSGHTTTSCHYRGEALDLMVQTDSSGKASASGKAQGDALANYAMKNAASLQVASVIWYNRIWSAARAGDGWRAYSHPSGSTNYTLQHMDHVHLSIQPCQN
jgi:murein DD-endopeptidase MepM/ murein hydrolase activator NlpD/endonuclease/exonuclease/phosphatase (EEP) superfamily protein YafD